ncbi:MAG: MFS transporter [Candidatus Methanofastidiosa archaeon]|nr:MFS transporter [Candidatus Methanofastidiosa archaeon]
MGRGLPQALDYYRGLPREIYVLFVSRVINTMGAFVRPFLTIFLTSNLGFSEAQTGLITTIGIFLYVPGSMLGGYLADRSGRKRILITARVLAAMCYIPCAFAGNSLLVPILLIASSFIGGVGDPASTCMVADLTNESNRKQAFSLLYLGINVGFSLGPAIAGILYNDYLPWIFIGDALTSFGSVLLIAKYVPETMPDVSCPEKYGICADSDERPEEGSFLAVIRRRPLLMAFVFINMMLWFVIGQSNFGLPLQTTATFGREQGPRLFGILMSVNGLVVVLMTLFLTRLTRALRPSLNISIAGVLAGIGYGMLYFVADFWLFVLSTAVWTLGEILTATNANVYIANHTPMSHRGRFNAIMSVISGVGMSFNPLLVGLYIRAYGIRMVWPLMLCISLLASALMLAVYRHDKRRELQKQGTTQKVV